MYVAPRNKPVIAELKEQGVNLSAIFWEAIAERYPELMEKYKPEFIDYGAGI